jgi:acyl carrier protein
MQDIYTRLSSVFHDVFDDDSIVVSPELTAADVPEWDSLSHIRLLLTVQKTFDIKFSAAQAANLQNVGELAALIRTKLPA